ncbi:PaaX family transcriptional regulator C-terminal domain-containing protein [Plastorhodobacter daqingensis]|uniref:PaaX family transcriptional regulator C-terminal domain-containing protein n=1 Tax=Plastorhodobacter daqingensis TaxID=1387281 RepID=A0ABW2UI72_9RHOB
MTRNDRAGRQIDRILEDCGLRAASFIVTIYGDVIDPRGGEVWMGNLIATCAAAGISETLVRTAVSRLVTAGQLSGEREGRRSYYSLTPEARAEFAQAAQVLFHPPAAGQTEAWRFVHLGADAPPSQISLLEAMGFARVGPQLFAGPARGDGSALPGLVFSARMPCGAGAPPEALRDFAAAHWDLDRHAAAYARFIGWFTPLARILEQDGPPGPGTCLTARLLLVHLFRAVLLRDPRLPGAALPTDWPGHEARRLFSRSYLALSPGAESAVAADFVTRLGPLPPRTAATLARAQGLEKAIS